jgi:hypothetical protein
LRLLLFTLPLAPLKIHALLRLLELTDADHSERPVPHPSPRPTYGPGSGIRRFSPGGVTLPYLIRKIQRNEARFDKAEDALTARIHSENDHFRFLQSEKGNLERQLGRVTLDFSTQGEELSKARTELKELKARLQSVIALDPAIEKKAKAKFDSDAKIQAEREQARRTLADGREKLNDLLAEMKGRR